MSIRNHIEHLIKTNDSTPVESFEYVILRLSGMRFTNEYEILKKEDVAEISQYEIRYNKDVDERILEKQVLCEEETILQLFNDCKLLSWDGFVGKHPKGVSDGIMFTLEAVLNDRKIYAHGSENFPRHYREFVDGINDLLKEDKQ